MGENGMWSPPAEDEKVGGGGDTSIDISPILRARSYRDDQPRVEKVIAASPCAGTETTLQARQGNAVSALLLHRQRGRTPISGLVKTPGSSAAGV